MRTVVVFVCWNMLVLLSPFQAHWISMKCGVIVFLFYLFSFFSSLLHSFPISAHSSVFSFLVIHHGYSSWTSLILRVLEHVWSATLIHHSLKQNQHPLGLWSYRFRRERKSAKKWGKRYQTLFYCSWRRWGMEKEQELEWLETQKIVISEDLVGIAKKMQLQSLAIVDKHGCLYDGPTLQITIYWYNVYWFPLLAKHS